MNGVAVMNGTSEMAWITMMTIETGMTSMNG